MNEKVNENVKACVCDKDHDLSSDYEQSNDNRFFSDNIEDGHGLVNQEQNNNAEQTHDTKLIECQTQLQECQLKYMHAMADLQNFKNRVEKERAIWISSAQAEVLKKLLNIIDDFDRAIVQSTPKEDDSKEVGDIKMALGMMHKAFHKFLDSVGVSIIPVSISFDPEKYEAIMQVISDSHQSGEIVSIIENGYMLGAVVLRPAKVSIAQ